MKKFIKSLVPPILFNIIRQIRFSKYGWGEEYNSWDEAKKASTGYDSDAIIKKVRSSLLKVKNGEAAYERDSVLFNQIQYSWPLLAGLMYASSKTGGVLNVCDFGGSLGSTYYQNKKFLAGLQKVSWSVVEQKHFVEIGKKDFEDERLKFYYNAESCIESERPNVLLFSGLLQYIEKPYKLLDEVLMHDFDFILLDRTTLTHLSKTRLTIQYVPREITGASYPIWLFAEEELKNYFSSKGYKLVESFFEYKDYGDNVSSKGYIYEKI